jgi:hypothetical protein
MDHRFGRRQVIAGASLALLTGLSTRAVAQVHRATAPYAHKDGPRSRVLVVNDLCGDIDGLFSTVHAILSPSTELRGLSVRARFSRPKRRSGPPNLLDRYSS